MKKTALVTTTIRIPEMLKGFWDNANLYQHDNIEAIVIGDKKTPCKASEFCASLPHTRFLTIEAQEKALKDYPELLKTIPYNCGDRKLLGMLIAYLGGFDTIIAIDDDNFVTTQDYFRFHKMVGEWEILPVVENDSGWFNAIHFAIEEGEYIPYHRGFPHSKRKTSNYTVRQAGAKVVVNEGFWQGDPDIDATTRLCFTLFEAPLNDIKPCLKFVPHFGLQPGTWCTFNNQNTAFAREVIPAYFTPPCAKRYSDLWPAMVVCCIAGHLNHIISYGYPIVEHRRNEHSLWKDVQDEKVGARATEPLIEMLRSAKFTGDNYHTCLGELLEHLETQSDIIGQLPDDQGDMLFGFISGMQVWHRVFSGMI